MQVWILWWDLTFSRRGSLRKEGTDRGICRRGTDAWYHLPRQRRHNNIDESGRDRRNIVILSKTLKHYVLIYCKILVFYCYTLVKISRLEGNCRFAALLFQGKIFKLAGKKHKKKH